MSAQVHVRERRKKGMGERKVGGDKPVEKEKQGKEGGKKNGDWRGNGVGGRGKQEGREEEWWAEAWRKRVSALSPVHLCCFTHPIPPQDG